MPVWLCPRPGAFVSAGLAERGVAGAGTGGLRKCRKPVSNIGLLRFMIMKQTVR
jgi:hypothetical protein